MNSPAEIARLRNLLYTDYLLTDWWQYVRQRALERASFQCQACGARNVIGHHTRVVLQVHHLTYARLGEEADDDLAVLCRPCHLEVHAPGAIRLAVGWTGWLRSQDAVPTTPEVAARQLIAWLYGDGLPSGPLTDEEAEKLKERAREYADELRRKAGLSCGGDEDRQAAAIRAVLT